MTTSNYQRDVIWLHVPIKCPPVQGVLSAIISIENGATVSRIPSDATLLEMLHNKDIRGIILLIYVHTKSIVRWAAPFLSVTLFFNSKD